MFEGVKGFLKGTWGKPSTQGTGLMGIFGSITKAPTSIFGAFTSIFKILFYAILLIIGIILYRVIKK